MPDDSRRPPRPRILSFLAVETALALLVFASVALFAAYNGGLLSDRVLGMPTLAAVVLGIVVWGGLLVATLLVHAGVGLVRLSRTGLAVDVSSPRAVGHVLARVLETGVAVGFVVVVVGSFAALGDGPVPAPAGVGVLLLLLGAGLALAGAVIAHGVARLLLDALHRRRSETDR